METPKINITIDQTTEIKCDACGNTTFIEVMYLRRASALLTGSAKDGIVPIPTISCAACGNINQEFIPEQLKSNIVK